MAKGQGGGKARMKDMHEGDMLSLTGRMVSCGDSSPALCRGKATDGKK